MKNLKLTGIAFIACTLFLTSCSKESIHDEVTAYNQVVTETAVYNYNTIEQEILEEVNIYRAANGLEELKAMAEVSVESEGHNHHMISEGEVSHDNFALRASKLMNRVGAKAVAENVGFGYRSAEAVVSAWLKSQGHRENIEGEYTHFGISVRQDAEGKNYFTNIFIKK
ncbi:CAP domain-containing protein [Christiangramia sabulilitoris]|uniref:CAP domain-containing protein n=1 Tax=Christiangramia sabulilitoris TaxID=2583991 RepID=A0A550HWY6_9FLAO|nr:CAP domain-containing protein [Christiangramia sabulilitoris]TRO63269.1 CAP domain-containing protein [Christiangramia sabulilitoris]